MKKILYFVVFTFLCFVGVGDVDGKNLQCNYKTQDGTYDITLTVDNSNNVSILNRGVKAFSQSYYSISPYNPVNYTECPKYAYYIDEKDGDGLDGMMLFADKNITSTISLPYGGKNKNFDAIYKLTKYDKSENLQGEQNNFECNFVDLETRKANFSYVYSSKEEYLKIGSNKVSLKSLKVIGTKPYTKKTCPIMTKYDDKNDRVTFYYDGDTISLSDYNNVDVFVNEKTPMAYCEYKDKTYGKMVVGYVGQTLYTSAVSNLVNFKSIKRSNFIDENNNASCPADLGLVKSGQWIDASFDTSGKDHLAELQKEVIYPKTDSEKDKVGSDYKALYSCQYEEGWVLEKYSNNYVLKKDNNREGQLEDGSREEVMNSTVCPNKICIEGIIEEIIDGMSKNCVQKVSETDTAEDIAAKAGVLNGERFKKLLGLLHPYLEKKGVSDGKGVTINGNVDVVLSTWPSYISVEEYKCTNQDCTDSFDYELETKVQDVARYCNDFYGNYYNVIKKKGNTELIEKRMDECISFDEYYTWLVQQGYVRNLQGGCGIISQDMIGVINWVLNIIKIAGPILAIVLGMLDFAKVMVAEDADKTYKEAWKKFIRRIIAAVLLLLTPMLLSFILNFALGGQDGYDTENPFCNMVDWSEVSE